MNSEYYTVPPFLGVKPTPQMPVEVEDLIIGRKGYGEIFFPGKTVLGEVDLETVVHINKGSVVVYPDDTDKPPIGSGFNKPAVVTLCQVWRGKNSPLDFETHLRMVTDQMGAEFLEYVENSGSWTFRVSHFSKYGLNDSDEETEPDANLLNNRNAAQVPSQVTDVGKGQLKTQNVRVDLLGRPVPFDIEDTVPKSLFFDSSYNEDVDNYNQFIEQPHMEEPNHVSKTTIPPSQSIMKFVNNERLYGLKATLFEDEQMEEDKEPERELILVPQEHKRRKEGPLSFTPINLSFVDRSFDLPVIQSSSVDSMLYETPRRLTSKKRLSEITPYDKSLLFRKNHLHLDAGCFQSLSFRVGWSPQMFFIHKSSLSQPVQETLPVKLGLKPFSTTVKSLPPSLSLRTLHCSTLDSSSWSSSIFCSKENMLKNLQKQLKYKILSREGDVPLFSARPGVDLLGAHYKVSRKQAIESKSLQDAFTVWSLCAALWGPCQEEDYPNSYNYHLFRKELFSDWLITTTSLDVRKELDANRQHLDVIFSLLSGKCVSEACSKALEFNELRLGLLLSQYDSFCSFRSGLLKQLENWYQFEVDKFVDAKRIKILALLAGKIVWKMREGTVINCCEDLDWKRAMALHLWYQCLPTASIQDALLAYEESFKGTEPVAPCPYPPYIESDKELHVLASVSESSPLDMCYYLLKLYCDRSTPLGKMLVPLTYGPSQLDYSLSWMVYQVLLSLGYSHLPVVHTQLLHLRFASQLEALGLWEWAVFVLLHVNEACRRKHLVMEVLLRHVTLTPNEEEQETECFLTQKLCVPDSWLFAAKAILARSVGNYREEAWCLLKSNQWNTSHKIITEKIAPDCIIHEQFDYLKSFLTELSSPEISSTIQGWSTGGEVYLDYIHVSEKIEQMMSGQVRAYEIEELHPMLISLSNRICNLHCPSAKDRLCQSEMSKKTVTLLRALITLRKDITSGMTIASGNHLLASFLPRLPMPEDYALQEMRATVRSYMLEATSIDRHMS